MNPILLATDGSPSAENATREAIDLALALDLPLHVVVVWHPSAGVGFGYTAVAVAPEINKVARESAVLVADTAVERARLLGLTASSEVREGVAADEICEAASACSAKMIVMGAHGWSSVKRLFLGSVSTRVLHEAPCGVLVVRGIASEVEETQRERQVTHA